MRAAGNAAQWGGAAGGARTPDLRLGMPVLSIINVLIYMRFRRAALELIQENNDGFMWVLRDRF